jgi:predicted glutamine amidotransferase
MCGLLAMHTKNTFVKYHTDEFKQMLIINSLRGAHSTGVCGIRDDEYAFIKATGSPYSLYAHEESVKFFENMDKYNTVIGHGRYATLGKINAENQHPFKEGKIILAHNGMISNFDSLKGKDYKHIEVDSHLICALFNDKGAINVLPDVQGAYVFMWYDLEEETFNVARNSQRPLFIASNIGETALYFSSEKETLEWNQSRNKTAISAPVSLPTFEIWSYANGSTTPTITKYSQKVTSTVTYYYPKSYSLPYSVGDIVHFIPVDYQEYSHSTHIIGQVGDVTTRCALPPNMSIDSVFSKDKFTGTVGNCYSHKAGEYTAWLTDMRDFEVESDLDTIVTMYNFNGLHESISKRRLKEICANGCHWCKKQIKSIEKPLRLTLVDVDSQQECLCEQCTMDMDVTIGGC